MMGKRRTVEFSVPMGMKDETTDVNIIARISMRMESIAGTSQGARLELRGSELRRKRVSLRVRRTG
jgi:hypothetical protein